MNKTKLKKFFSFIFISLICLVARGQSVKLSVSTARGYQDIAVGDIFYIRYEVNDMQEVPSTPNKVEGAKVMYDIQQMSQSSKFTSINGQVSQSYSFIYNLTLKAEKEGSYSFGPVKIGNVTSNIVRYNIVGKRPDSPVPSRNYNNSGNSGNNGSSANGMPGMTSPSYDKPTYIGKGDGNLFLRAEISKTTAYPQEALVYTVKLYSTYDAIKFIGATAAPKFDGFVIEESNDISNSLTYETYNGKSYATAIIARYIIFPQREGKLKVSGNTYTVSVDEREYYFDPFFRNMSVSRPLQLNVTPNDLSVNVIPLPSPKPADFSGGVGQFEIKSQLPDQDFLSNAAASIVYTIQGTGNLKYITLPDLNNLFPPQIEVYSPTAESNVNVNRTNVSGSIKYDYSFMPLESGTFKIPDISLCYFNPSTGKYETTVAKGYTINVKEGKGSEKSQTKETLRFKPDYLKIKNNLQPELVPIISTFGFWVFFYIIPFVVLIAIIIYYRRYIRMNSDIIAVRSRKASKVARNRLRKAAKCMKAGETEKFYEVLLQSILGYISDKLKLPVSELNRNNIKIDFEAKGVSGNISEKVINLIDDCEFFRYSSNNSSKGMNEVYYEAVDVIDNLEKELKKS